ncbi:MAG: hypothetical protein JW717_14020 [Marinilabiliaceae bacterium]|nr:hypothetical protein [Marinilabiliaceae bacterium]
MISFVLSIFLSGFIVILGQAPELRFQYFSQREGLSNSFITSVSQDSTGYIWIGTVNNLNRFDGIKFLTYEAVFEDSTKLPHHHINSLYTDKSGKLWISTRNGICSYNKEQDNFIRYKFDLRYSNPDDFNVNQVSENSEGEIFVSASSIIYRFDSISCVFKPFVSIATGEISKFIIDRFNNFWIAGLHEGGLTYYNYNKKQTYKYQYSNRLDSTKLINQEIHGMVFKDRKLWLGTRGAGLLSLDTATHIFRQHINPHPNTEQVIDLFVDKQNRLWVIDFTGLKYYNTNNGTFYGYYPIKKDKYSIRGNINKFYQDKYGNYWALHSGGGIGLSVVSKGFAIIDTNESNYWRISSGGVNAINKDNKGNLWIGNSYPGIDIFNFQMGRIEYLRYNDDEPRSLGGGSLNVIFIDNDNKMWVGTYDGGLQKYDAKTRTFEKFIFNENNPFSISGNDVRSIDQDENGDYWIAVHGNGIDRFNSRTRRFVNLNKYKNNLSNPWTNQVLCASNGDLWVGTAWGLNKMAKGDVSFENYYYIYGDSSTICSSNISVIFESKDGSIWIGTDKGLNKYNRETNSFSRLNIDLLNIGICAIKEDKNRMLWISTVKGISRLNPISNEVKSFYESDGILGNEFISRSSYQDNEGIIYFGGVDGITYFDPMKIKINTTPPPVILSNVKVLNKSTNLNDPASILKRHISYTKYFEIDYENKLITFEYIGINFNNPERNEYSYTLEGFDHKWYYVGNDRLASYTNLKPGVYTFRVKAANNDGVWNEKGASVTFKVLPPWYMTFIAKIGFVIVGILVFWLALLMRTKKMKKQRKLLKQEIAEKTQELVASNQELMAQAEYLDNINHLLEDRQKKVEKQTEILVSQSAALRESNKKLSDLNATKDKLFSIIAHDLLNPFNTILGMTEVLSSDFKELSEKDKLEMIANINSSSNRLFNLLQNLLLWARSQTDSVKFEQENFVVFDAIEESTHFLYDQIESKNIGFEITGNKSITAFGDVDMFKTIIRNLVNNAIKFTRKNGNITVSIKSLNSDVIVSVTDNGVGMTGDALNNLFKPQLIKGTKGTEGERGTGLGLVICKEFIERNNGTLSVISEKGQGSTFSFTIPESKW